MNVDTAVVAATCVGCGMDDLPLNDVSRRCVYCQEATVLRWDRWQRAAREGRSLRWMRQHGCDPLPGWVPSA